MEGSGVMQTGDRELSLLFVKWVGEHAVPRNNNRAFHQVLQLTNVARPRIPLEGRHGFRRNVAHLLPHAAAEHPHKMCYKGGNVFAALSKRRQHDGEDVQTIVEITAKLPASYHLHEI